MAVLVLWLLILASIGGSDATWCVCRGEMSSTALQKTLDYACGAGADCSAILQNGGCYQPNTLVSHCSYAVNSYFQRKGQAAGTCDFAGTAMVATTDPSYSGCSYPSTAGATGTPATTPTTATPGTTPTPVTPTTTPGTPTTFTPGGGNGFTPGGNNGFTPGGNNGVLGGLGPSGPGNTISTDANSADLPANAGAGRLAFAAMLCLPILLPGLR